MQIRLERDLDDIPVAEKPLRISCNHDVAFAHAAEDDFVKERWIKDIIVVDGLIAPCVQNLGVDYLVLVGGEAGHWEGFGGFVLTFEVDVSWRAPGEGSGNEAGIIKLESDVVGRAIAHCEVGEGEDHQLLLDLHAACRTAVHVELKIEATAVTAPTLRPLIIVSDSVPLVLNGWKSCPHRMAATACLLDCKIRVRGT